VILAFIYPFFSRFYFTGKSAPHTGATGISESSQNRSNTRIVLKKRTHSSRANNITPFKLHYLLEKDCIKCYREMSDF